MKRRMSMCILIFLLLLAALVLNGCGGDKSETSVLADSEDLGYDYVPVKRQSVLGEARLEDCTLTIHYDDGGIYRLYPLRLEDYFVTPTSFDEDPWIHNTTVSGADLVNNEQFQALLEMLNTKELPPTRDITEYWNDTQPTVYYALTDIEGERLFDVGIGWDNRDEGGLGTVVTVNFNGEKIPFDELFYTCVERYLTEPHFLPGAIPSQGNG